ncbi:MAG: PAS domain-containing protein, partial [Rhodobacterales bacterium]|nr:PAS domain-containing protein [Rhodobacterales bacterium]
MQDALTAPFGSNVMLERGPHGENDSEDLIQLWRTQILENALTLAAIIVALALIITGTQGGRPGLILAVQMSPALVVIAIAKLWKSGPFYFRAYGMVGAYWLAIFAAALQRGYAIPNPWVGAFFVTVLAALVFEHRRAWGVVVLSWVMWAGLSVPWVQGREIVGDDFSDLSQPRNWTRIILIYVLLSSGATTAILFFVSKVEKALKSSTNKARELRQLVETANAPIFGIDTDGNVNEWNATTALITGFSKTEAMGQPLVK